MCGISNFVHVLSMKTPSKVGYLIKSVDFKKTVAQISFLSKLWYRLFGFVLKIPQF